MKTQTTSSKPESKGGLASRLNIASWRKLHVATMTADEEAWPQREPSGNLGRIFVLLLLLHVFIIGAVVLYNIITPKSSAIAKTEPTPVAPDKAKSTLTAKNLTEPRSTSTAGSAPLAAIPADNRQSEMAYYEVRSGDNVPGIAAKLHISPEELITQNKLGSTELFPGLKLQYLKKTAPQIVTLSPGKSVTFPTSSNGARVETSSRIDSTPSLGSMPNKKDSTLSGDNPPKAILIKASLPDAGDSTPAPRTSAKENGGTSIKPKTETNKPVKTALNKTGKDATSKRTHVVTSKDTLYSIAKKYGVKVSALQKANDIKDPTTLKNGTRLVIPAKI